MGTPRLSTVGRAPVRILFLNWRDCRNPEGGGSEIYVETIARALAAGGNDVTIHAASFPGAAPVEDAHGVRLLRSGSKLGVYPSALSRLRRGRLGEPDVIVDVQNGIPFGSPLARSAPTVVLVHHVHREQWPVVYDPVRARIGWWIESRLAPRIYRHSRYVAVSEATRAELVGLGVDAQRIAVVHNGVQARDRSTNDERSPHPRILVLGRLVPHKRVEHVLHAAAELRHEVPGLTVSIVGDGWWRSHIEAETARLGIGDLVEMHGFVDERAKQRQLRAAWVLAIPSLKEGWGLVITEAAAHGVPSVGYRSAGGVAEAIQDGTSGLLVDGGEREFTQALRLLLTDPEHHASMTHGAGMRADSLSWAASARAFADVLAEVVGREVPTGPIDVEATLEAMRGPSER